jgi:serine/threonine-protein kinase
MGTVLRAEDELLGRQVAVKLVRQELASDPRSLARFRQEARIAASLSHPGIAAVYDFVEEEGRSGIVMELLDGQDLHTILQREGPMEPAEASRIVAEAADALAYAHDAGAVHRDIKPANIFITRSGAVKITDFGVAYAGGGGQLTTTGALIGTPDYLSPEQVRGQRSTASSDIYSLGCVAFQVLTGTPPFTGDNPIAVATARLDAGPPSAQALNPAVPDALDAVVAKAMAPRPEDRFPTAAAMAEELRGTGRTPAGGAALAVAAPDDTGEVALEPPPEAPLTQRIGASPATLVEAPAPARPRLAIRWGWPLLWTFLIVAFLAGLSVDLVAAWQRQHATRPVPHVTDLDFPTASAAIQRAGFRAARADVPSLGHAGYVVGASPAEGARLKPGSTVTLSVGIGNLFRLADVRRMDKDAATSLLQGEKLNVIQGPVVPGTVDNQVAAQDPAPGTQVAPGASVTLTVTAIPQDQSSQDNPLSPLFNLFGTPTPPGKHKGGD